VVEDQRRNIARMSVAVAHKTPAFGGLVDSSFEHPEVLLGPT
jgi:hypothetical protein